MKVDAVVFDRFCSTAGNNNPAEILVPKI